MALWGLPWHNRAWCALAVIGQLEAEKFCQSRRLDWKVMGCTTCLRHSCPGCPSCKSEYVQFPRKPLWFVHVTVAPFKSSRTSRTSIDIQHLPGVTMAPVKSGNSWKNLLLLTSGTERLLDEEDIDFGSDVYALAESSWNPISFYIGTNKWIMWLFWPQWALAWQDWSILKENSSKGISKFYKCLKYKMPHNSKYSKDCLKGLFEQNGFWHRFVLSWLRVRRWAPEFTESLHRLEGWELPRATFGKRSLALACDAEIGKNAKLWGSFASYTRKMCFQ